MLDPHPAFMDPIFEGANARHHVRRVNDPITRQAVRALIRATSAPQGLRPNLEADGIAKAATGVLEPILCLLGLALWAPTPTRRLYYLDSTRPGGKRQGRANPTWAARSRQEAAATSRAPTGPRCRTCQPMYAIEAGGVPSKLHHHEAATAGQSEDRHALWPLLRMADSIMIYKYMVKNVARQCGLTATFMPKPLFDDSGSGMHVHQSLWTGDKNVFYDETGYAQLSDVAKYYIGGLLKHAPALLALAAPTTNSYRRLVPGFEAP